MTRPGSQPARSNKRWAKRNQLVWPELVAWNMPEGMDDSMRFLIMW
ncbi:MAG: hypothetical protein ACJAV4_001006, partial [Pontimonas sp.]